MKPLPASDLIIGHQTHAGETGKNNEDRALLQAYKGLPGETGEVTLAVVADGIGGHRAGEIASQIAVDTFKTLFNQTDSRSYLDLFTRAFASIQQALVRHIAGHSEAEGMGTTCSAVVIANRRLYLAYIGDSRIYLLRNGSLRQVSIDHTWVQEAIEHGILTKEEARKHPNRHVVRRHLGAGSDTTPDFRLQLADTESQEEARRNQGLPLKGGDIVLLSSDGMTDLVEDHEILAAFGAQTPQEAVDSLVLLARQRGGFDNITITALQIPESPQPAAAPSPAAGAIAPALLVSLIAGAVAFSLIVLAAVSYFLIFGNPFAGTLTPTPAIINPTITPAPDASLTPTTQRLTPQPATPTPLPPPPTRTLRPPTRTLDPASNSLTLSAELTNVSLTQSSLQTAMASTAMPTPP